jgi:glycolate oxidase iron-sulfur subunit
VKPDPLTAKITRAADQCVKCGLCLPHCPTYRLRQDEAESPRGRIALIQALAEERLAPSARLRGHLQSCLECRACEVACPSLVQYGELMDDARALEARQASAWRRALHQAWLSGLSSTAGTRAAAACARVYRASGLARLVDRRLPPRSRLNALHRVAIQLARPVGPERAREQAAAGERGVDLFLGCVARAAEPAALTAARRVLTRIGWAVHVPPDQGCCGAMHRHNGFPQEADRRLTRNAAHGGIRPLVGVSTACVAELRGDPRLAAAWEICRFLDRHWPAELTPTPLQARVAVHEPCSQRNLLRDPGAAYDLLRRIPGVTLMSLPENPLCCGAAGTHLLSHPAMAQELLAPKLAQLRDLGVDLLVTTNTGCALHLAAGAREAGLALRVLHPVELIARQLGETGPG